MGGEIINAHVRHQVKEGARAGIKRIIDEVCEKYQLRHEWVMSPRRARSIAWPRQEIMWRASQETAASLPLIGQMLGGRDHTTVIHGIRRHQQRRDEEKANGTP